MTKFTVWVCESNGRGTTHVSSHEAETPEQAADLAMEETNFDWGGGYPESALHVLGIAKGDVEIVEWNDLDAN